MRETETVRPAQEQAAAVDAAVPAVGTEQIRGAWETLRRYKQGKANLEQRVVDAEKWFRLRHWECMRREEQGEQVEPASGWLLNCIMNKHADAMDNFPAPNILPRERGDEEEAQRLSSIVPVILDQAGFEKTYSDHVDNKLIGGTGVYGVFWDGTACNGLGDIDIRETDVLNLFWEPGKEDIQESRDLFHTELMDNDVLLEQHPQLAGKLGGTGAFATAKYAYDDAVDTNGKSVVVDWYYKRLVGGRTVLHYCKFVGDTVLYATENDPQYAERGLYDHGQYPFVFDPLIRLKGTPCGFGYVDIGKCPQEYIDRGGQAVLMNMLANTKPRFFIRSDGGVNEEEFADQTRAFVHVTGNLGEDSIVPITGKPLSSIYLNVLTQKIDELKETTGNRDISTGGTTSGVTAASAIAAMQEAGSKLSRDHNKSAFRAYRQVILLVVELIRQFYSLPRQFRITGEDGVREFITYTNRQLQPQVQGMDFGTDMGLRLPLFDVEITAQKQSPYSKMSQNELALQFYNNGFFNPELADQSLACLEMMDFDRKQAIMQRIAQNGTMYQQMQQMQQQMVMLMQKLAAVTGDTEMLAALGGGAAPAQTPPAGNADAAAAVQGNSVAGGDERKLGESATTKKARQRVADATAPA